MISAIQALVILKSYFYSQDQLYVDVDCDRVANLTKCKDQDTNQNENGKT